MAIATKLDRSSQDDKKVKLIFIHGDKGGVGKSFVAQALINYLWLRGEKIAVIDADTRNPDVSRMFDLQFECFRANLRSENGWMDVMNFVLKHPGYHIVLNTPSGIGEHMKADMEAFADFLSSQDIAAELELWWVMNIQHDSVNLLNTAYQSYGQYFKKIRVVCNLHFSNGNSSKDGPFVLWNESVLRANLENRNGMTLYFPGLHIRVVQKIFSSVKVMPFSDAEDAALGELVGLEGAERWKLQSWMKSTKALFDTAFGVPAESLKALLPAQSESLDEAVNTAKPNNQKS